MWLSCGKSVSAQIISFFIPYQRLLQPVPEVNVTSWLLEVRLIVSGACPRNGERNLTVKICQSSQKLPWQSGCLEGSSELPLPRLGAVFTNSSAGGALGLPAPKSHPAVQEMELLSLLAPLLPSKAGHGAGLQMERSGTRVCLACSKDNSHLAPLASAVTAQPWKVFPLPPGRFMGDFWGKWFG